LATQETQVQAIRGGRHDPLTGLVSRRLLNEATARRFFVGEGMALILAHLRDFGAFRAAQGDSVADEVLKAAAHRLRTTAGCDPEHISRLDGDTFAILTTNSQRDDVEPLARLVTSCLSKPFPAAGHLFEIVIVCGIAIAPEHAANTDGLARAAQTALEQAKTARETAWRFYDSGLEATRVATTELKNEFAAALSAGEIVPYYQPIVDLRSGKIVKLEVLARWQHRTHGIIEPNIFIPMAESLGLTGVVTNALLEKVSRDAASLPKDVVFCLNASPDQLRGIIALVTASGARARGSLSPERLEVELTERALNQDIDVVREVMRSLQAVGTRVVLDDFGFGASNLFHLCELPFDGIKSFKGLAMGLSGDARAAACFAAMVELGHSLGMGLVAAGIEDAKTLEQLIGLGCVFGQGYFFSRPIAAHDLAELFADSEVRQLAIAG
jgi:diguanylate cyclase (GGDEF)-like protein